MQASPQEIKISGSSSSLDLEQSQLAISSPHHQGQSDPLHVRAVTNKLKNAARLYYHYAFSIIVLILLGIVVKFYLETVANHHKIATLESLYKTEINRQSSQTWKRDGEIFRDMAVHLKAKSVNLTLLEPRIRNGKYIFSQDIEEFVDFQWMERYMGEMLMFGVQGEGEEEGEGEGKVDRGRVEGEEKKLDLGSEDELIRYEKQAKLDGDDFHQRLAISLTEYYTINGTQTSPKILPLQHKKANIHSAPNKNSQELPICIFIQSENSLPEDNKKILQSLERQNYSNFHVVWVQEPAGGQHVPVWSENLRVRVVRNRKYLGTAGNIYFWVRKYCKEDEIVFLLGKNTALVGHQALKILNAAYQKPSISYTQSPHLLVRSPYDLVSSQLHEPEQTLSPINPKYSTKPPQIRSFRRKLLNSVSIQSLLQFRVERKSGLAVPEFLEVDVGVFGGYGGFGGIGRGVGVEFFLEVSLRVEYSCERMHQQFLAEFMKIHPPSLSSSLSSTTPKIIYKKPVTTPTPTPSTRQLQPLPLTLTHSEQALQTCLTKYRQKIDFNLKNPVKVIYSGQKNRVFKKTVYNEHAVAGRVFGQDNRYFVDLGEFFQDPRKDVSLDWRSFKAKQVRNPDDIFYVLTPQDFQTVIKSNKIDFTRLKLDIESTIPFQILQLEPDPSTPLTPPPPLNFTHLKSPQQATQFLTTELPQLSSALGLQPVNDTSYSLAVQMQMSPEDGKIVEAEYYYLDQMYGIGGQGVEDEARVCIVSAQFNVIKRKNGTGNGLLYQTYFQFLETLNYTNFHIVYIDDASTDNSAYQIYSYLQSSKLKSKNRIKIVHTLKNIGITANIYFWPQKLCGHDDIVLLIDADDNILGRQSLKVFNALYQGKGQGKGQGEGQGKGEGDGEIWYAFTRHLMWQVGKQGGKWTRRGYSFGENNENARREKQWAVSNTRSFRTRLMKAVPLYHFIEYHFETTNYIAWPIFQDLSADSVQVYAQLELAGNARIAYYEGMTYAYSGSSGPDGCYMHLEMYDWRKTGARAKLAALKNLDQTPRLKMKEEESEEQNLMQVWMYEGAKALQKGLVERRDCFKK